MSYLTFQIDIRAVFLTSAGVTFHVGIITTGFKISDLLYNHWKSVVHIPDS